jgi:hypothetical protein
VTTAVWIGLAIFCVAVAVSLVYVGYQVFLSWRVLRRLPSGLLDEMNDLSRRLTEVERRLTGVEKQIADLQRQLDSLGISVARAKILAGAAGEVRDVVEGVRGFFPTK